MPWSTQVLPNGGRAPNPNASLAFATVSQAQPAPSSFSDPLFVVFDYDTTHSVRIDAKRWPASHGATLPALGAAVLLGLDNNGEWWVLAWEGSHS